jgi:Domain of unknown function (DUF4105)
MNEADNNLSNKQQFARTTKILKILGLYSEKLVLKLLFFALAVITLLLYCWSVPCIYFSLPWMWLKITASILFAIGAPTAIIVFKPRRRTFFIVSILTLAVTICQQAIPPTNDRDWKTSVARLPGVSIKGNDIRIYNIRNFDYRSVTDFTPRYYSKNFKLDEIRSLDYILSYWDGNKAIAHSIFSFGFKNGDYLAVSVETRLSKTQKQSLLGGVFNQYELIYILADERDVVRLRTNFRKEQVYLYRVILNNAALQKVFLKIIKRAADLRNHPRFYNTVKHNCLTTLLTDLRKAQGKQYQFDYRFVMNGYSDKLLYDKKLIITDALPFKELKKRRHINQYIQNDPNAEINFSQKIRPPGSGIKK